MDRLKLRIYDGVAVTGFLILPALFSTELSSLAKENDAAGWLALLIAFAVMTCLFLVMARLMKSYGWMNIVDITSSVLGKPCGVLYGIFLGAYFCFFTGINIRESTEILKIYGLNLTPLHVVAGLILLTAVIMNFFGGRSIIKSAGFFFVIIVFGIIFVFMLGLGRYDPDQLVPVLGNGLPDIIRNGFLMTSLFDGVIVLFLFAPAFSDTSKMKKAGVLSLFSSALAFILLFICYIMMFSSNIATQMVSGFIEMGKSSYFNHFFYRFESILLFFLIFSTAIQASLGLLAARKSFNCAIKLKPSKTATVICAVPILAAIFIPDNILDLFQNYLPLTRRYGIVFMAGVPLLVLIIDSLKKVLKHEKN